MRKSVILETHNLKNPTTGFGTFNYGLIRGLSGLDFGNLDLTLLAYKPQKIADEFGDKFKYKKIYTFNRHKGFRIRKKHDLWHSVNQNLKFEPHKTSNYLLTIHDVNFAESAKKPCKYYKAFLEKLERSNAITYISEYAREQTHSHFTIPDVPEYIIYNGNPITGYTDTTQYKPEVPTDKPFLYSIGDFLPKKNFIAIVEMMLHIPDFNLVISGNNNKSYGDQVSEAIIANKLQNRVFLTGKVSDSGKQYYLSNCSGFLFPSIGEGFGLPPIEAMKFGKPIFLANRTSLPEIGGEFSFYWDEFDPEYMASQFYKGMESYNGNVDFYKEKYIERSNMFSWDKASQQYLDVYNSILK